MSLAKVVNVPQRQLLGALGIASFLLVLAGLDVLTRGALSLPALVPPFGASVVIVFFTPESVFGRPWNVIVGHFSCAFAAASVLALLPAAPLGVLAALAVASAGLLMLATRSFHPPGGATALLAVVAQPHMDFAMLLCPMLLGSIVLVLTRALLDLLIARSPRFSALRPRALHHVRAASQHVRHALRSPFGAATRGARVLDRRVMAQLPLRRQHQERRAQTRELGTAAAMAEHDS